MAGTATNFDATKILTGYGKVWVKVAVPGAGARLTLHTDKTPDSTANPDAVHLGLTEAGSTATIKATTEGFEADELTVAWKQQLTEEEASIKGVFLQVEDWELLGIITPGGTFDSGSGYEELTFGGLTTISTFPVALIGDSAEDPTKAVVFHIYDGFNTAGIEFQMSRKTFSKCPFEFKGNSIASRAAGDQAGNFWRQV